MAAQQDGPSFRDLSIQLAAYAVKIFAEYGLYEEDFVIPGTGLSMPDFVAKTLGEYATGKIKYHSSRGELMSLLGTALKRDVHDAVLRKRSHLNEEARDVVSTSTDKPEGNANKVLSEFPGGYPTADRLFDEQEYKARILHTLEGEPELKELADIVFELEIYERRDQAEFLGITVQEVDNRKKRLKRRLVEYGSATK